MGLVLQAPRRRRPDAPDALVCPLVGGGHHLQILRSPSHSHAKGILGLSHREQLALEEGSDPKNAERMARGGRRASNASGRGVSATHGRRTSASVTSSPRQPSAQPPASPADTTQLDQLTRQVQVQALATAIQSLQDLAVHTPPLSEAPPPSEYRSAPLHLGPPSIPGEEGRRQEREQKINKLTRGFRRDD